LRLSGLFGRHADLVACGVQLFDEGRAHVAGANDENFHGDFLCGLWFK
jgi:hypothetical protein